MSVTTGWKGGVPEMTPSARYHLEDGILGFPKRSSNKETVPNPCGRSGIRRLDVRIERARGSIPSVSNAQK